MFKIYSQRHVFLVTMFFSMCFWSAQSTAQSLPNLPQECYDRYIDTDTTTTETTNAGFDNDSWIVEKVPLYFNGQIGAYNYMVTDGDQNVRLFTNKNELNNCDIFKADWKSQVPSNQAAMNNDDSVKPEFSFPENDTNGWDNIYRGCSIWAARNLVKYLDLRMTQNQVDSYITVLSDKATTPASLERGLQDLLDDNFGDGSYTVHRKSLTTPSEVAERLTFGYPVIVLVGSWTDKGKTDPGCDSDGTTHWVAVTGVQYNPSHNYFNSQEVASGECEPYHYGLGKAEFFLQWSPWSNKQYSSQALLEAMYWHDYYGVARFASHQQGTMIWIEGKHSVDNDGKIINVSRPVDQMVTEINKKDNHDGNTHK